MTRISSAQSLTIPYAEFIALMALMTSLIALSIDSMLPALNLIGRELAVSNSADTQLIISYIFLGMALSQVFYGPLADAFGRRRVVLGGLLLFIIGTILSATAEAFTTVLVSRVLQGIGIASPRIVSMAIVRDLYSGRAMARVMSFIMSVFIIVPIIAPAIGQGVMILAGWRAVFWVNAVAAMLVFIWFGIRQNETLPAARRVPLSVRGLIEGFIAVLGNKTAMGYTIISGLIFGVFLGYLSSAQLLFQEIYQTGQWFPALFACLAASLGLSSFYNGRRVVKLGMRYLTLRSLKWLSSFSGAFLLIAFWWNGVPPLWLLMIYLLLAFSHVGVLFGNMTSQAMEPLGERAGIGAGVVGSVSTLLSVPLGILVGRMMGADLYPLICGFLLAPLLSLALIRLLRL